MKRTRTPVIQRVGNMINDYSVCHIGGVCFRRFNGTLERISKEDFDKSIKGCESRLETWDPLR